ncbi:MAG TPA: ABC transporter permease [Candidatus Lustribacter sp.]|jgi:osmoprotectant transport system permease protein|nr:ABC transporter permease [Candidatus Lustribacter sp.]
MTYILRQPEIVATRFGEHLLLTFVSLAIALAIAFPLGVLVARRPRAGAVTLAGLNVIYTIPSLALLAILIEVFGLGAPTAIVALVAYAQMILVRNIAEGLRGVSPAALDAADGLGFTPLRRLLQIEIPLALPAIVGGIRIATVALIGIATIAAWIDAGGLGALVFDGLHQDNPDKIVAGSLAAVVLALAADGTFRLVEKRLTR